MTPLSAPFAGFIYDYYFLFRLIRLYTFPHVLIMPEKGFVELYRLLRLCFYRKKNFSTSEVCQWPTYGMLQTPFHIVRGSQFYNPLPTFNFLLSRWA